MTIINSFYRYCFQCIIDSPGPVQVVWFKDGIPITSPDYEQKLVDNVATLTIEETFSEDSAVYLAQATNEFGAATTQARLNVHGKAYQTLSVSRTFSTTSY